MLARDASERICSPLAEIGEISCDQRKLIRSVTLEPTVSSIISAVMAAILQSRHTSAFSDKGNKIKSCRMILSRLMVR